MIKELGLKAVAGAGVLALGLSFGAEKASACMFIIDDFNVDTLSGVTDNTASNGPVTGPSVIDGTNIVMGGVPGWTRSLSADLLVGDAVTTEVCNNCKTGEFDSDSASTGNGDWTYEGPSINLLKYLTTLMFSYSSDLDGAVVEFVFGNDNANMGAGAEVSTQSGALPNTGGADPSNLTPVMIDLPNNAAWQTVFADVTDVQINVFGVPNLDFQIDDAKLLPEPGTLGLFGLGLMGLGLATRRKKRA